jgi:hypothetical protein
MDIKTYTVAYPGSVSNRRSPRVDILESFGNDEITVNNNKSLKKSTRKLER